MPYLYQEISESIRRRIAAGELLPGDRLPTVRELAQQWNCTPGTVSRAYLELAEQGLVGGHRGSGTRVLKNLLIDNQPGLEWANLVNRAEQYLLEVLSRGHTADEAQSALAVAVSRWKTLQQQTPSDRVTSQSARPLRFAGSHDLTVELLAQKLKESKPEWLLELEFVGSLGGLISLTRGEAEIAGVHLWDASTDTYNLPFIQRVLPNQRLALVTLVHRELGFIVPQGNPQRIENLGDLTQPSIRWVNRQPGSGTRVWLDEQLQKAEITSTNISGYDNERTTHMAVAQAIQTGQATVGLGILAAALAYELNFIPLTTEVYQLVVPEAIWESSVWHALLAIIRSDEFSTTVNNLGGYDTSATGQVSWI